MLHAFALAFRQLRDPRLLRVMGWALLVTLALFAVLGAGLWFALQALTARTGAPDEMAAIVAWVITLLAGWALFRGIAVAVLGLFADGVVAAVEARHYPVALESCRPVGAGRAILMGLASLGRLIGYNLLAVPLYIVVAATGIGLPVGFLLVNGWLLGRDLGDMVAARHIGPAAMQAWRSATRWPRFGVGLASAGLFAVPVVNLIAPVVGAAAMTHLFHRGRKP